jgi:hypothetical protein
VDVVVKGRLPDFLVIGARQGGATPLVDYLRRHPGIFVPPGDDGIRFFSGHEWHRGVEWYAGLFADAAPGQVAGERSNFYTRYPLAPEAPARAASVVPGARLLYVIRHPIDRIEAHYLANRVEWETAPIDEAVRARPDEYVAPSRYATQVERWLDHFPPEQLLVLLDDDLKAAPTSTVEAAARFVGADAALAAAAVTSVNPFRRGEPRQAGGTLRRLRRSPAARRVARVVPTGARARARRVLSTPLPQATAQSRLSESTRAWVLEQLDDDLRRLRRHVGPSFGAWGLVPPDGGLR